MRTCGLHARAAAMASFLATAAFQYPWEHRALNQEHLRSELRAVASYGSKGGDRLQVSAYSSAPAAQCPHVLDQTRQRGRVLRRANPVRQDHHGRLTARISRARLLRAERAIEASVDRVVAIGEPDLPRSRARSAAVVTPFLDPKEPRWSYRSSRTAFFVGNVAHLPNWGRSSGSRHNSLRVWPHGPNFDCGRRRCRGRHTRPLAAAECRLSWSRRPQGVQGTFRRRR